MSEKTKKILKIAGAIGAIMLGALEYTTSSNITIPSWIMIPAFTVFSVFLLVGLASSVRDIISGTHLKSGIIGSVRAEMRGTRPIFRALLLLVVLSFTIPLIIMISLFFTNI